jgi:hypothetical protein
VFAKHPETSSEQGICSMIMFESELNAEKFNAGTQPEE